MMHMNINYNKMLYSTCQCEHPIIVCGGRGCRCKICGLLEDLSKHLDNTKEWVKPVVTQTAEYKDLDG